MKFADDFLKEKLYNKSPVPRLRMLGAIPPLHQYVLMASCLIKQWTPRRGVVLTNHRDNFTFTFSLPRRAVIAQSV
jgi:hypothetical protein